MSHLYYTTSTGECQDFNVEEMLYIIHTEKNTKRKQAIIRAYKQIIKETGSGTYKNKLKAVEECGTYFHFKKYETGATECVKANRCKDRYCSYCNWVEARKKRKILMIATENLRERYKHINHLTITVPNVPAEKLNRQTNVLHSLITRALRHFGVKDYYRTTEITYNKEAGTYHPHAHILILKYIKIEELSAYLSRLYKEYDPSYKEDFIVCWATGKSAVTELTKYITKPDDFTDKAIQELINHEALKGVRFSASAGVIKEECAEAKKIIRAIEIREKAEQQEYNYNNLRVLYRNNLWETV